MGAAPGRVCWRSRKVQSSAPGREPWLRSERKGTLAGFGRWAGEQLVSLRRTSQGWRGGGAGWLPDAHALPEWARRMRPTSCTLGMSSSRGSQVVSQ